MIPKISKITELKENCSTAILFDNDKQLSQIILSEKEREYLQKKLEKENEVILFKHPDVIVFQSEKR